MRLKNKISGEIKEFSLFDGNELQGGATLESLTKEWEDVSEEPKDKDFWFFDEEGIIRNTKEKSWPEESVAATKEIGNYFETKEEAEKAVEKLKAWKRLKDKGFRFRWIDMQTGQIKYSFFLKEGQKVTRGDEDDLLLLFGGEE